MAACVAGLTLGLMTLDTVGLEIMMHSSNEREAEAARRIMPVRQKAHLLLVTLLLGNTIATELLPLVLEVLFPGGISSLVLSVVFIMIFGEIIPQAVCSRHALEVGSRMIGFVRVIRFLMYPIAAPIAYALDKMLGHELGAIYTREELKGLVQIHARSKYGALTRDESIIIQGTLDFSQQTAGDVLTKAENVFSLSVDDTLNEDTLKRILEMGHSRVPLWENNSDNIICSLLVKQLILVDKTLNLPIRALIAGKGRRRRVAPVIECTVDVALSDLLNEFQKGLSHLGIVYDNIQSENRKFVGIITIEDIIEEILQEEILDETDQYTDNNNTTLARPQRENILRKKAKRVVTHARLPGTSAILIREVPAAAVLAPGNPNASTTFFPDRPEMDVLGRGGSNGPSESMPLLPLPRETQSDLSYQQSHSKSKRSSAGAELVLPIETPTVTMEDIGLDARGEPSTADTFEADTAYHSVGSSVQEAVRSRPLPTYIPQDPQDSMSRRARAKSSANVIVPTTSEDAKED